jgi:P27 family predicted phage terminase small subunit
MQKLPKHRKQLTGTHRPDKDRRGVQPGEALRESPPPPEGMSDRACIAWEAIAHELVELGVLTTADLTALALLCETQATASELEETIQKEGFTLSTGSGGKKAHPALKSLESTRNCAARLLAEFGLTPKSRKFVEKAPGPGPKNPFDHLDDDDFE